MRHAVLLLTDPAHPCVSQDLVDEAARLSGRPHHIRWLAPGIAAEFLVDADESQVPILAEKLRALVGAMPIDVAVLPADGRKKRLLVADMDSTMIAEECLDELAAEFGLKAHIAAITERAMRGEIAFEPALRERVALLAGFEAGAVEAVLSRITLTPGGKTLVATMRADGAYTALVSGGFTCFTAPIAARIGFDENRGNVLVIEGGRMIGLVSEPILGRDAKRRALTELRDRLGLGADRTMAVGDGANDLAMIEVAGMGVAFHAKPAVAEAARVRIDHGDLTALLYLQGYSQAEFAAA